MHKVFLLLGSNLADRFLMLSKARDYIQKLVGEIKTESHIYESAPWGFKSEKAFLNQILIIDTLLNPTEILEMIKLIEKEMGRVKTSDNYESRIIDIDILFYNNEIIELPNLVIPHPQLHKRRFTLVPLAEIDPMFRHPILKKTMQDLLNDCDDNSEVNVY